MRILYELLSHAWYMTYPEVTDTEGLRKYRKKNKKGEQNTGKKRNIK
jgi:hypothetical protein